MSRRASVSVLFALSAMPIIALLGLALDFGIWTQSNATLSVAANVAAMTAAKIAVNAQLAGDNNAFAEGRIAGQQWFLMEIGSTGGGGADPCHPAARRRYGNGDGQHHIDRDGAV